MTRKMIFRTLVAVMFALSLIFGMAGPSIAGERERDEDKFDRFEDRFEEKLDERFFDREEFFEDFFFEDFFEDFFFDPFFGRRLFFDD